MKRFVLLGCCMLALIIGCKHSAYQYRASDGKIIKTDIKPIWWGEQNSYIDGIVDEADTKKMIAFQRSMEQAEQASKAQEQRYQAYEQTPDVAKEREHRIKDQFDVMYGNHLRLTAYVKSKMNDPASFEHVATRYADQGTYVYLEMDFRGKNALGAKVLQTVTAKAKINGELLEAEFK